MSEKERSVWVQVAPWLIFWAVVIIAAVVVGLVFGWIWTAAIAFGVGWIGSWMSS